jgi:hypothetical protein
VLEVCSDRCSLGGVVASKERPPSKAL